MTTPNRYIPEEAKLWKDSQGRPIAIVEVTIRCIMGMFLLTPRPHHVRILRGVLAKALKELDFELFGYAFLSNHGSMIYGVRDAAHMSAIMQFIHGNIARELGRPEYSDWMGRFWGRRGRPITILSDEDLEARMRYLMGNSTKENLVTKPQDWPGAHCARALCDGKTDAGLWIDRTGLRQATRRSSATVRVSDFEHNLPVTLTTLPCWAHLSEDERRDHVKGICRQLADEAALAREESTATVLGAKAAARVDPHTRPKELSRSPAPLVHCCDAGSRTRFEKAYRGFCELYRAATAAFRAGLTFTYPPGGIPIGYRLAQYSDSG